jgi:hypothetical protein
MISLIQFVISSNNFGIFAIPYPSQNSNPLIVTYHISHKGNEGNDVPVLN